MTPAERLRAAAEKIREAANRAKRDDPMLFNEGVKAAPTIDPDNDGWLVCYDMADPDFDSTVAALPYDYHGALATFFALWSPDVALAVADWLDNEALVVDDLEAGTSSTVGWVAVGPAFALADLILGAES